MRRKKKTLKVSDLRKRQAAEHLIDAAGRWVRTNGGYGVVGGPIGVMESRDGNPHKFSVVIDVLGTRPGLKQMDGAKNGENSPDKASSSN